MSRRAHKLAFAASFVLIGGLAGMVGQTFGAFTSPASNAGNNFATANDYRAPTINRSVIGKTAGGTPGFIKQGGTYYAYADVTDTGNPASGISSVTSNTSTITTGATATSLASGSFTAGGLSYSHRTTSLTANATLTAGTYTYTVTTTDAAGNSSGAQSYSVTVDNTVPSASDIQTANGGSTAARPEANDTITFTYSEPIDPNSILANWTGSATSVVVRVNDGGLGNDTVQIWNAGNTAQLPLGSVNLGGTGYVSANRTFGASGTASSMSMSGNAITVTLGTQSGAGTTQLTNTTMTWTPSATATDRAGNAASTTARTETGAADREF